MNFATDEKGVILYVNGEKIILDKRVWIINIPDNNAYLFKAIHPKKGTFESKIDLNQDRSMGYEIDFKNKKFDPLPIPEC